MKRLCLPVLSTVVAFHLLGHSPATSQSYSQADLQFFTEVEQQAYQAGAAVERYSYWIPAAQQKSIAQRLCQTYNASPKRQRLQDVIRQTIPEVFAGLKAAETETAVKFTEIIGIAGVQTYCPENRRKL